MSVITPKDLYYAAKERVAEDHHIREFRTKNPTSLAKMLSQLKSCQANAKKYNDKFGGEMCSVNCKRCLRFVQWLRAQKLDAGVPLQGDRS